MANLYAFDAGFSDARRSNETESAGDGKWHEVTIKQVGAAAFGVHCGLKDGEIVDRGEAWQAACSEYDRGFAEGLKAQQH